jgi:hypothetical protein
MTETRETYVVINSAGNGTTPKPVSMARELEIIMAKEDVIERAAQVVAAHRAFNEHDGDPLACSNLHMALGLLGATVDRLDALKWAATDDSDNPGALP